MKKSYLIMFLTILLCIPVFSAALAQPIEVPFVDIEQYTQAQDKTILIDVRSENSRERSNLIAPGAIWINPASGSALEDFIATKDKDQSYTVFCSCVDDNYSIRAAQMLTKNGFKKVSVLKGGWDSLINSGIKMEPLKSEE